MSAVGEIIAIVGQLLRLVEEYEADANMDEAALRKKLDSLIASQKKPDHVEEDAKIDEALKS